MAHFAPAEDLLCLESEDTLTAGALGFMPRILVLTTLPHRRPEGHRFERVNGRHSLRIRVPGRVGLPYGTYPRLILAYLTTEAVRTKNPEIHLGATPNDLARNLELSTISGPRGTAQRLEDQLRRLLSMRLHWKTSLGLHPTTSGSSFVGARRPGFLNLARELFSGRLEWRPEIVLSQNFFEEIAHSAVPIDLRALRSLKASPLAMDLYVWLTYRMSYLKKLTVIPWASLQSQFGADYARPRDFRRKVLAHLTNVFRVYPAVRVGHTDAGLRLYPSPPHIRTRKDPPRHKLSKVSAPSRRPRASGNIVPGVEFMD
ncbi:MAG: replication protein RepA [Thermoanaerobaculia bacterium]